jgi:hypothetical protein
MHALGFWQGKVFKTNDSSKQVARDPPPLMRPGLPEWRAGPCRGDKGGCGRCPMAEPVMEWYDGEVTVSRRKWRKGDEHALN